MKGRASIHHFAFGSSNSSRYVNLVMGAIELLSMASVYCPQNLGQFMYEPLNFKITSFGNLAAILVGNSSGFQFHCSIVLC